MANDKLKVLLPETFPGIVLLAALTLSSQYCVHAQSAKLASPKIIADAEKTAVTLRRTKSPLDSLRDVIVLDVATLGEGQSESVELPSPMESVSHVVIKNSVVSAVGRMPGASGSMIYSASLGTEHRGREIMCFRPAVSRDGELVVFENWYPRYSTPAEREAAVSAVDLTSPGSPVIQLFPPRDSNTGQREHSVISPKLWGNDGLKLIFVDKFSFAGSWDDCEVSWVILDFSNWPDTVIHVTMPIDPTKYLKPGTSSENVRMVVSSLRWADTAAVEAALYHQDYWLSDTILVEFPPQVVKGDVSELGRWETY